MSQAPKLRDREIAAGFRDGPTRAPRGLLGATLASTRHLRQRPAPLALLLGAPGAAPAGDAVVGGVTRRQLVLVGLLIGAVAGAIAVAGAVQLMNRQTVVLPPPRATATARASTPPSAAPATPAPVVRNDALGFAVMRTETDPFTEHENRWHGHEVTGPERAAEFDFGTCPDRCGGGVSVSSSSPWYGVIVAWTTDCAPTVNPFDCAAFQESGGSPIRLRGASADELAAAWIARFGPSESERQTVEGMDEVLLWNADAVGAVFARGGRTFSVMVHAADGSPQPTQLARLRGFLDSLRFPQPDSAVYRDDDLGIVVSAEDIGPWQSVHEGWGPGPGDGRSVAFWFGQCTDNLCNAPYISISHGDPATGAIARRAATGEFSRVRGSTIAELRASWAALFSDSTFEEATIDGRPALLAIGDQAHMSVLAVLHGKAVSISITPGAFAPFERLKLQARLTAFTAGAIYIPTDVPSTEPTPEPSPAGTLKDLTITMPAGWVLRAGETRMSVTEGHGGLFSRPLLVVAIRRGTGFEVPHPTAADPNAGFDVAGNTFEAVVASIDTALPDASRRDVLIGGQPGVRWSVPQTSYVAPLVNIAVVEWKKTFYLFVHQLPLDGPVGSSFDLLLAGVRLD